jgi:hypothetical protein
VDSLFCRGYNCNIADDDYSPYICTRHFNVKTCAYVAPTISLYPENFKEATCSGPADVIQTVGKEKIAGNW